MIKTGIGLYDFNVGVWYYESSEEIQIRQAKQLENFLEKKQDQDYVDLLLDMLFMFPVYKIVRNIVSNENKAIVLKTIKTFNFKTGSCKVSRTEYYEKAMIGSYKTYHSYKINSNLENKLIIDNIDHKLESIVDFDEL